MGHFIVHHGVVENPAETQTSIRLASQLVRAPNSRSLGREFESHAAGTRCNDKKWKDPLGQVFLQCNDFENFMIKCQK
jgi:hypothetical protein